MRRAGLSASAELLVFLVYGIGTTVTMVDYRPSAYQH